MADPRAIEAAKAKGRELFGAEWDTEGKVEQLIAAYLAAQPQETPEQKAGFYCVKGTACFCDADPCRNRDACGNWRAAAPAKAGEWRLVPVKNLVALYSLVGPPPVVIGGKKVTFVPPDPVALVAAMRAELDAMLAAAPQKAIPDAEGLINYLRVTATAAEWNLKKSGDHFIKMEDVKRLRDAADALTAANERADEAEAQGDIDAQASYEWRERAHKAERAVKDYEEWGEDVKRLTRQLDVEMHGDGAAKQASLCDLIGMHTRAVETIKAETVAAFRTAIFAACEGAQEDWPEDVPYARGYRSCAKRIAAQAEDAFRALSPATAPMTKGPQHG